jgi:hypothetical protein
VNIRVKYFHHRAGQIEETSTPGDKTRPTGRAGRPDFGFGGSDDVVDARSSRACEAWEPRGCACVGSAAWKSRFLTALSARFGMTRDEFSECLRERQTFSVGSIAATPSTPLRAGSCKKRKDGAPSRSSGAEAHIDFIGSLRGAEAPLFHESLHGFGFPFRESFPLLFQFSCLSLFIPVSLRDKAAFASFSECCLFRFEGGE